MAVAQKCCCILLHVCCKCVACMLHVRCIYVACTLHVCCMYSACLLHVCCMYVARMLYVCCNIATRTCTSSSNGMPSSTTALCRARLLNSCILTSMRLPLALYRLYIGCMSGWSTMSRALGMDVPVAPSGWSRLEEDSSMVSGTCQTDAYAHVYTHVYTHVDTNACTHAYTHVCTHACKHVRTHVYKHVHTLDRASSAEVPVVAMQRATWHAT